MPPHAKTVIAAAAGNPNFTWSPAVAKQKIYVKNSLSLMYLKQSNNT